MSYTLKLTIKNTTPLMIWWIMVSLAFASMWYKPPTLQRITGHDFRWASRILLLFFWIILEKWGDKFPGNFEDTSYKFDITHETGTSKITDVNIITTTKATDIGFKNWNRRTEIKKPKIQKVNKISFMNGINIVPKTTLNSLLSMWIPLYWKINLFNWDGDGHVSAGNSIHSML